MSCFSQQYQIDAIYRQRVEREAESARRIITARRTHHARGERLHVVAVRKPLLWHIGRRLEAIGTAIQARYGEHAPAAPPYFLR